MTMRVNNNMKWGVVKENKLLVTAQARWLARNAASLFGKGSKIVKLPDVIAVTPKR